jgi:predicted dehydrogenase
MWLLGPRWRSGHCRYYRHPGQVRIRVLRWVRLEAVDDAYVVPTRSLRRIVDYVGHYGLTQTLRKVRSRLAESGRNRKYVACGVGEVAEVGGDSGFHRGDVVYFLAPFHPACVSEVCLDERLVRPWPGGVDLPRGQVAEAVLHGSEVDREGGWAGLCGWSDLSGTALDHGTVDRCLETAFGLLTSREVAQRLTPLSTALHAKARPSPAPPLKRAAAAGGGRRPTAVLFGLGHYAKNVLLPRVSRHLEVACIHELDPAQLGPVSRFEVDVRTSAFPEADERYDVYLVAGYHHTHAPIAVHAVESGAAAVVEKPLVTNRAQLDLLIGAMSRPPARVFAAFQRRYTRFNDFLRADLEIREPTPVSCQAQVYQIPLPGNHWYRWPSSRSRVVSNGCHWIDHFLFLNEFAAPIAVRAFTLANGDVVVAIDLENEASFTMTMTTRGSARLGVREVVQYRVGSRTATLVDQRHYDAESSRRPLRRVTASAREAYDRMYETIGRRVARGEGGDSIASVQVSMATMLAADEQVFPS